MPKIETLGHRIKGLAAHWRLFKPEGPGPFPLVVQMHGCGGCHPFQDGYARVANAAGVAALVVDSYPHRAISPMGAMTLVCSGMRFWGRERAGDLYAAFQWARAQPFVRPDRLFAAGWSHGGWSVLDAMARGSAAERARWTGLTDLPNNPLEGLAGAFVVYPYCGLASMARLRGVITPAPVHAIVCGADHVVGGVSLQDTLKAMKKPGDPIAISFYRGATHSFDEPEAKDPRFRYDPRLTQDAQKEYAEFLGAAAA